MGHEGQYEHAVESKFNCLLFDVDDTLYPFSSGLSDQVTKNIQEYMLEKLGIEESKVPELCVSLYKDYGTTMAGLKAIGYDFDYDDFHGFVHGRLPYELLKPDPVLRNLLLSLPIRKVVFTNADEHHAARVLNRLGLEGCFEKVICFETLNPTSKGNGSSDWDSKTKPENVDLNEYLSQPNSNCALPSPPVVVCKPLEAAFEQVFKMSNIDPKKTLFFDDSIRNIQTGKRVGLYTVMVGTSLRAAGVDYALESIHNLKEALPDLWEANGKSDNIKCSEQVARETSVTA